jgi:hypothetical protein
MPRAAYSIAAERVRPTMPALVKVYGEMFSWAASAVVEEVFTIAPPPPRSIASMPYRRTKKTPSPLTRRTRSQLATSISCSGCCCPSTPALLKMTSIRPYRCTASAMPCSTEAASPVSMVTAYPSGSPAATRSAPSASMSATTTLAPSAANRRAAASPSPDAPPVTSATLSWNRIAPPRGTGRRRPSPAP